MTINRGYTEIPGNVPPDVPFHTNKALRQIDTDVQKVDTSSNQRDEQQKLRIAQLEAAAGFPNNPVQIADGNVSTVLEDRLSASSAAVRKIVDEQAFPVSDLDVLRGRLGARDTKLVNVVLTGSSTIAGHNISPYTRSVGGQLAEMIYQAYPKANGAQHYKIPNLSTAAASTKTEPGIRVINAGAGGRDASNFLDTSSRGLIKGLNPAAILMMNGSNDYFLKKPVAQYKAEMLAQLDDFSTLTDTLFILCHAFERQDVASPVAPWSAYGQALKEIAESRTNTVFVDLSRPFAEMGLPTNDPFDLIGGDLIHATEAGHNVMAATLKDALMLSPQRQDTGWLLPTYNAGYKDREAGRVLAYRVVDGVIYFRGGVSPTTGSFAAGALVNAGYISTFGLGPAQPNTGIGIAGTTAFSMRYAETRPEGTALFVLPGTSVPYVMFSDMSYPLEHLDN